MQKKIYLASPYTSPEFEIREKRYQEACKAAALIMSKGDLVFSPIAHSHPLAVNCGLRGDFEFWQDWCLSFLSSWASHFCILPLPGWNKSKGVAAEKALAEKLGLTIITWDEIDGQDKDAASKGLIIAKELVLDLPLNFYWYDLIKNGQKRVEYREISRYWTKRLFLRPYKVIRFRRGYTDKTMFFEISGIEKTKEKNDLNLPEVYKISLGARLDRERKSDE